MTVTSTVVWVLIIYQPLLSEIAAFRTNDGTTDEMSFNNKLLFHN